MVTQNDGHHSGSGRITINVVSLPAATCSGVGESPNRRSQSATRSCHGSVKQPGNQRLSRWNPGTDGESPEGRMRVALSGETRGSRQCPELTDSRELTGR